ncbi:SusC/RagA family TonB-linked outer membrane protein [Olivibacter sp. SDN3]|uniref:SusC/RagA family TonB-linked outer membrane protein n=1 Tax=Olivibacter sp. SDN3 TaxID=2764720 RepID=UPI001650DF41|nr:SusC/RagA family TonB-linked outer membrane protein [Olivibacter sp. SDN3]QNL48667.1 SusC/RagA family TonB-linked outer membrane protein [Olivibacter sp. SDN3]
MKNKELNERVLKGRPFVYILTGTKRLLPLCALALLILCSFSTSSTSVDRGEKIDLSVQNVALKNVLPILEKKGKIRLMYSEESTALHIPVSIDAKGIPVLEVLARLLVDTGLEYKELKDDLIVVRDKSQQQSRTISGLVKSADGQAIAGASVLIKGMQGKGTRTAADGSYSLEIPANATLIFTYLGYLSQEITVSDENRLDVVLQEDAQQLGEVVVTAMGIKRENKKLGYSASAVNPDQLIENRMTNFGNNLSGKVAGLNVSPSPTGPGGSSKIRLRGQSSFGGNNSPLIVVNGVPINNAPQGGANDASAGNDGEVNTDLGDGLQSINPDDIASLTVLKGAAAAALYGFRAKDGAIIITTKAGSELESGLGISYSSSFQADQALDYTDFQYEYGQGEYGIRNETLADARRTGVWSFGPRFDGLPIMQHDGVERPYLPYRNRVRDFYDLGRTFTNSLAVSGANEKGNFRVSFANTSANSIVPNSNYNKKIFNVGLNYNLSKDLSVQVNANYSNEFNDNPPVVNQQAFNVNQTLYTLANSIDLQWLENAYKDAETGDEIGLSRFTDRTNPYWSINERFETQKRDRLFGNVSLRYQFAPWLWAQGRIGQDYFTNVRHANRPSGTAMLPVAPTGFNGNYFQNTATFRERNIDLLVGTNQQIGLWGIDATFGMNSMDQKSEGMGTSVTNFFIRDLYTVDNGQIKNPIYTLSHKRVNAVFGTIDFSFDEFLFLNLTGRNDWFSTLNPASNSAFYPSASTSFVFSQIWTSKPSWLDFGKLRASYAEVGGDTNPYTNTLYYNIENNLFNGIPLGIITSNISPNANLRPLTVKETEFGIDFKLFDNRLSVDVAAYNKLTVDEILNVDISNASGYEQTLVNVGRLRNRGIEASITVEPIRKEHIKWESVFNYAYNRSKVLQLADNQSRFDVGTGEYIGVVSHEVGLPMASLRGVDYLRNENGEIITSNGLFLPGNIVTYGSAVPLHTGGWLNTITYKGIRFFAQIDFKGGHKMISNSNFNWTRHGLHQNSLVGREGGVVFDGVNSDGSPNATPVEAELFYSQYRSGNIATPFIYDAGFIRARTLSLGYDLSRFFRQTFIKSINANLFVNNPFIIRKQVDNLDPETQYSASDLSAGLEAHALPTTRTYGLNLNVNF